MDRTAMLSMHVVVFFLVVLASSILAAGGEVYELRGGAITLAPGTFSAPLVRIVWKHGDDKAIEWEGGQPDAYRQFKGSTSLDTKTGEMTITKLDPRFDGVYSADVNGNQATTKWKLTVLDHVSEPITKVNCTESTCELSCKNKATVEVQCAWRKGEEELRQSDGTLKLEKTDGEVGKAYICNCSNPVSFAVSEEIFPFPEPKPPVGIIVGSLSGLFILGGVIALIFRKKLTESVQTCCGTRGNAAAAAEGGAKDPQAVPLKVNAADNQDGANETSEAVPLKENAAGNQDGANETSEAAPLNKNAAGNQDGANETSEAEPIYVNAADNQDGANETSQDMPLNGDTRC